MSKSLIDRKAKLQAELKAIQKKEAEILAKKDAILARVVRETMAANDAFSNQVTALLDDTLKKQRERDLFELPKLTKNPATSTQATTQSSGMSFFNRNTENVA